MKNILFTLLAVTVFFYSLPSEAAPGCRWVQGKGRVCTPVVKKSVVVVKPSYHHVSPWAAFTGVVGAAIIIDKVTGEPSVEGKDSIVVETKMVETGKVDVIEQDGKVIFIKGVG